MKIKKRLDLLIADRYPHLSRQLIQSLIMQGKARLDGVVITKPGTQVDEQTFVELDARQPKYVGRAGFKLEHALHYFGIDVTDRVVLDAGLSTGGFTDCLLQHGARKVYGVDVGYGQVHEKIRADSRVVVMERTNLRTLTTVGERVDMVTLDLSFISVLKVMQAVCSLLKDDGQLVVLIKPQFEARKEDVGRGGIIKDAKVHQEVIERVTRGIVAYGFTLIGVTPSPLEGADGNKEFFAYCKRDGQQE